MQEILENYLEVLSEIVALGIGRSIGTHDSRLEILVSLPKVVWAIDRQEAEELQTQEELGDFLLFLRPDGEFADPATKRSFDQDMNEVASRVRVAITEMTRDIQVSGFTNEPVGLGDSDVIVTFRAVAISGAQERVAEANYGLIDPLPCRDLLSVYRAGHILCGYLPEEEGQIVLY